VGRYQALFQTWLDEIARRCRARRITWIPVYTADAIDRVFVDALARAGVVAECHGMTAASRRSSCSSRSSSPTDDCRLAFAAPFLRSCCSVGSIRVP
jgi:hypothetical protein